MCEITRVVGGSSTLWFYWTFQTLISHSFYRSWAWFSSAWHSVNHAARMSNAVTSNRSRQREPSSCFFLDLCDLLDSFSLWCWPRQRGYNISLVLGGRAASQKTHGWPFPAHRELLTLLLTVLLNEKLGMMRNVKCSTLQFASCSIPALFWKKGTIQCKATTGNEAQFLHHLQLVGMN